MALVNLHIKCAYLSWYASSNCKVNHAKFFCFMSRILAKESPKTAESLVQVSATDIWKKISFLAHFVGILLVSSVRKLVIFEFSCSCELFTDFFLPWETPCMPTVKDKLGSLLRYRRTISVVETRITIQGNRLVSVTPTIVPSPVVCTYSSEPTQLLLNLRWLS